MRALAVLVLVGLGAGLGPSVARAEGEATEWHVRVPTPHGPVHVWRPAGYDPDGAGVVVYVHGYYVDVDTAWRRHRLARQFRESGLNATFIACGAPRGPTRPVVWSSLPALLAHALGALDDPPPTGPLIAVGHSGAHRTIEAWLADEELDTVVLLDGAYGDPGRLRSWVADAPERRLITLGAKTRRRADALHARLPATRLYRRLPPAVRGRLEGARAAQVVYVRSHLDHMQVVTGGVALPMLLRATRIPMVASAARDAPITPLRAVRHARRR